MKSNINLNWLRTFEVAARLSGFSAAGKELGLTQVAVSQHIKSLETKLGHDLFVRHAKKVQLTDAGKAYLLSVREGLDQLTQATYGLFGTDINKTVVVRASVSLLMWLAPKVRDFYQQNPDIKIKFVTSIWPDPLDTQKIDLDIILSSTHQHSEPFEKLADEYIVPIAGTDPNQRRLTKKDLARQQSIHILGFDDHWSRYLRHINANKTDCTQHDNESTHLQVDTSILACELVAAGNGCAVMIERFANAAIQMGRPIRIIGEPLPLNQSHFLIDKNSDKAASIRTEVDAFKNWIQARF